MTELLYLWDSYAKDFEAKVTFSEGVEIELDRTLFYPVGGGQPTDQGTLELGRNTWNVLEVRRRAGKILHKLDKEAPPLDSHITGHLDWDRRYSIMRYHTALHVLSKVIYELYGSEVSGNQIYPNRARMDFTLDHLSAERLQTILENTHRVIEEARPIKILFLPREEAAKVLDLKRTRLDLIPRSVTEIRIIDIDKFDREACGGTHVQNTSEIGRLTVTKALSKGKHNKRIEFTLSLPPHTNPN
ncbi:MAG: alanyl-tRNA editing protein [Candidatus Heimdallarchaeota archaeon]